MRVEFCILFSSLLIGHVTSQTPVILNPTGTATLNELVDEDKCVYLLDVNPEAFTCQQDTAHSQFALQKRTGDTDYCVYFLRGQGALTSASYSVDFTCDDSASNTDTGTVDITIQPNAPPTFDDGATATHTGDASTLTFGNTIFTVAATDTNMDDLVFALDASYPEIYIDPSTGAVKAKVNFDTLTVATLTFKVTVTDSHSTAVEQDVTLNLNNLNVAASITNLPSPLSQAEDVAPGTVLYTCAHNEVTPLTMEFTVDPATEFDTFVLDQTNCEFSLKAGKSLDFETTPTMTVTMYLDDGVYREAFTFTLDVTDVNEPPSFAPAIYDISIKEGPGSTPVIQPAYTVNDEDASDTVTYSLGTGTHDPFFSIDPTTGALTTVSELDFDSGVTSVSISVIATDSGGETTTATVDVTVLDANDNDPVFATTSTTLYISPKTAVGPIGQVEATDVDAGVNGMLVYTESSDNSTNKFLVQSDGTVYLTTQVTEANRDDVYGVVVQVTDKGTPPRLATTDVIIVFDPPPVITDPPGVAIISEDTTSRLDIHQIVASDNQSFVCNSDSVTPTTPDPAFVVEKKGGGDDWFVFYTGLVPLSFTTTPTWNVEVTCTDSNGGVSDPAILTINVVQNTVPTIDCTTPTIEVDAAATKIGDAVHTVVASDTDPLTYSLILTTTGGTFIIDGAGVITSQKDLIRELRNQYIGVVSVTDTFNTVSCTITLTMTNTNERPVLDLPKYPEVPEDLMEGGLITQFTITDDHECFPTTVDCTLDPTGTEGKFDLAVNNKVVSVTLGREQQLDFESLNDYTFFCKVNDGCLESFVYRIFLKVTDVNEPPIFANGDKYVTTFNENSLTGSWLGCGGFDPDAGDNHTLTLTGGHSAKFTLTDPGNCVLTPLVELDRDTNLVPETFTLLMTIRDGHGLSATATVTVNVEEVNDNAPACTQATYTFNDIYNGDPIGQTVGTVAATDEDLSGLDQQFTFSLGFPSTGTNVVDMASDGTFTLINDPSALLASGTLLSITVKVTDLGTPELSSTCRVEIMYLFTTTTPPPTTPTPPTPPTTQTTTTTTTTTLSPVNEALQNPVIMGVIIGVGALAILAAIGGIGYCCLKSEACKGGNKADNKFDYRRDRASRLQSRGSQGSRVGNSPANKPSDITTVSEANGGTTMKYL